MLRLLGFFALVLVLTTFLGRLPVIGGFFAHTGFLGIWATAILLSFVLSRYGQRAYRMRRDRSAVRDLEAVDSPYNRGKLGTLLMAQGRTRRAIPHLRAAAEGESEVAEWHYRLGCALLAKRQVGEATQTLTRAVELDEEYAYGAAQMRLAEAHTRAGDLDSALAALKLFERNHGPSPESAYRRGRVHKLAGRRAEARAAFAEVSGLAAHATKYQRREAGLWTLKAWFARLL